MPEQVCPGVTYETEGVVALVRLDRPERLNAFTYEMIQASAPGWAAWPTASTAPG